MRIQHSRAAEMDEVRQDHQRAVADTRIVLRPMGSAMALGFFAFGAGALVTAVWDLRWVAQNEYKAAAIALLTFVMPLEMLASVFSFLSRDAAGGTAMGIFSVSWATFGTYWLTIGPVKSPILGIFTIMITAAIICLAVVAWSGKPLLSVLLGVAAVRDGCLAAFHLGATALLNGAGWCGLVLALFALYGGLAFLIEDVNQRTVLPLLRRGTARKSLEGSLSEQIERVEHEAGVRNQL
jgi:succinate-acetate transporter protein